MTSDAKVGLLLGLVFIVVIAFLINGLPGLMDKASGGKIVSTSVTDTSNNYGLTDQAGVAVSEVKDFLPLNFPKRDLDIVSDTDIDQRFSDARPVAFGENKSVQDNFVDRTFKKPAYDTVKFYVVKSGDSLGKIAKKVYGEKTGNKQAVVERIYDANAKILDNPDDIFVGQKLVIPSLVEKKVRNVEKAVAEKNKSVRHSVQTAAGKTKNDGEQVLIDSGMFEKISTAFKNVFNKPKGQSPSLNSIYVVKDGDSLWAIASRRLGSGTRHQEILQINRLNSASDLKPGMKLKIPSR